MKKKPSLLLIFATLLYSLPGLSQTELTRPINSHDIIEQGIQCHDRESYDSALVFYNMVNPNDPNYAWACYEAGITLYGMEKLDEAEAKVREAIRLKFTTPALYSTLGSILDDKGKPEEGIATIEAVYTQWPYNQNLLYNLGICYINAGKLKQAESVLLKNAKHFPFHARTHMALAKVNLLMGHTAEAYLAYNMASVMNPSSNYITEFEEALTGKMDSKIDFVTYPSNGAKWDELRWLLQSEISTNKEFKFPSKLDYLVTRQSYILFQKAAYDQADTSLYNQLYVRFFKNVINNDDFENLTFYQFQNTNVPSVAPWIAKNKASVIQFVGVSVKDIKNWRDNGFVYQTNSNTLGKYHYYNTGALASIGEYLPELDSVKTGQWVFMNEQGGIREKGTFKNGEIEGEYKVYHDEGTLKQDLHYVNGELSGIARTFYSDGTPSGLYYFREGKRDGVCEFYNTSGVTVTKEEYTKGSLNGTTTKNLISEAAISTISYKDDVADGPGSRKYLNGIVSEQFTYSNNNLEGQFKSFYKTGKLESEGNFKNDKRVGLWKNYHPNGQLKSEGNYNDSGNFVGVWKHYDFNGKLEAIEDSYVDGKLEGTRVDYFPNGSKNSVYTYKNDIAVELTNFDLGGKEKYHATTVNGMLLNKDFYPNGNLRLVGNLKEGKRNGSWRFYNPSGILTSESTYVEGDLSGLQKSFYLNGALHTEYYCDSNKTNGISKEYYPNGKLKTQSWATNNLFEGPSYAYHLNGNLKYSGYFSEGTQVGSVKYYDYNGIPYQERVFNSEGIITSITNYNTQGNLVETIDLPNGNGKCVQHFENGAIKSTNKYVMGLLMDTLTTYFPSGVIETQGSYLYNANHGALRNWDSNGKLTVEINYLLNDAEGNYKRYKNDILTYDENYINDQEVGTTKVYHNNGKLYKEIGWQNGERTGYSYYYSIDGALMYRLLLLDGSIVAFSYLGKDGKMVADIPVTALTGELVAYYPSGIVSARLNLKNGGFHGKRTENYSTGKKFRETEFIADDYQGVDAWYYPSGAQMEITNYVFDQENEAFKSYYENGKIKQEGNYYMGEKEGLWKSYDATGKLVEEVTYRNGSITEQKKGK